MPDVVVNAPPFNPVKPKILIGTTGTGVEIACAGSELDISPEQDETTTETFCGTYTRYKPEVWTVTLTAYPSYGATGLWNNLRPLVGTVQPFSILPDAGAVAGPNNPQMTGNCVVKAFPFYAGAVGEPTSIDVVLAVQGIPTFALALTAMAETETQDSDDGEESELVTA